MYWMLGVVAFAMTFALDAHWSRTRGTTEMARHGRARQAGPSFVPSLVKRLVGSGDVVEPDPFAGVDETKRPADASGPVMRLPRPARLSGPNP